MYRSRIGGLLLAIVMFLALAGPQPQASYAQDAEPAEGHPLHRHSIEDQTFHAWDRNDISPGTVPPQESLNLKAPSGVNGGANISRVYALNFDPIYQGGQRLSAHARWNNPDSMTNLTMASINSSAKTQYYLKLGHAVTADAYPLRNDGNRMNNAAYAPCLLAFQDRTTPPAYCTASPTHAQYGFSLARNPVF